MHLLRWTRAVASANGNRSLQAHRKLAARIANCANRLDFIDDQGNLTLANGYRCKARMCPICQGSKAREAYAILAGIAQAHIKDYPASFPVMLTLTVPNISADQLHGTIRNLFAAVRRFRRYMRVETAVLGWRRALEVSYNAEKDSYHPHLHVLLFMAPGYFTKGNPLYISQADWQLLWQKAVRLDLAIVDIRRKGTVRDGKLVLLESDDLAEVAKYVVKPQGYFVRIDQGWELPPSLLGTIHDALKGLRLYDYGGSLRKVERPEKPQRDENPALVSYDFREELDEQGNPQLDYWLDDPEYRPREPPDDNDDSNITDPDIPV